MSLFNVPCTWSDARLAYELRIASDELDYEQVLMADPLLSQAAITMHARVLASLVQKREAIEARRVLLAECRIALGDPGQQV